MTAQEYDQMIASIDAAGPSPELARLAALPRRIGNWPSGRRGAGESATSEPTYRVVRLAPEHDLSDIDCDEPSPTTTGSSGTPPRRSRPVCAPSTSSSKRS